MAQILSEYTTCDGHNVVCQFGNEQMTLHFRAVPTSGEKNAAIVAAESRLVEELAHQEIEENIAEVLQ